MPPREGSAGTVEPVNLGAPELIIVLVVILVLFGGAKLPKLARSLGQAQSEFKKGIQATDDERRTRATSPAPDRRRVLADHRGLRRRGGA